MKRRCWKAEASAAKLYTDPVSSLINLLPACPDNKAGLAYLTSFLLLNKDIETYKTLQESLYRSPAWRDMTECQQEAIVICSPNDPHFWLEHGVSIKVRNRANRFYAESARYFPFGAESCGRFGFRVWQNVLVLLYV